MTNERRNGVPGWHESPEELREPVTITGSDTISFTLKVKCKRCNHEFLVGRDGIVEKDGQDVILCPRCESVVMHERR